MGCISLDAKTPVPVLREAGTTTLVVSRELVVRRRRCRFANDCAAFSVFLPSPMYQYVLRDAEMRRCGETRNAHCGVRCPWVLSLGFRFHVISTSLNGPARRPRVPLLYSRNGINEARQLLIKMCLSADKFASIFNLQRFRSPVLSLPQSLSTVCVKHRYPGFCLAMAVRQL